MKVNLFLAAAALYLGGCGHVNQWQVHDRFDGVRSIYEANPAIDVLIVHGMGQAMEGPDGPHSGYSLPMQREIVRGLTAAERPPEIRTFPILSNGVLLGTVVSTSYEDAPRARKVTFYELSWAESVKPIKTILLELEATRGYRETNPLEPRRARLNSLGKAFINTHLADPVIYSGSYGATLRNVVAEAVCILTRRAPEPGKPCDFGSEAKTPVPIAIVTVSLGSALVFDALNQLLAQGRNEAGAAIQVARAASQMYMLANQLPLMDLRALQAPAGKAWLDAYPCPSSGLEESGGDLQQGLAGFLQLRRLPPGPEESGGPEIGPLAVTAFSDPNDLLTYFISERFKRHCKDVRFANVTVTNAERVWLFLAADPFVAHNGYVDNNRAIRLILDGGSP